MTKARKIDLLYQKVKGLPLNATPEELQELKKYKVAEGANSFYATKANLKEYVTAVDNGSRRSFYDWCIDNGKADRRYKGSDSKKIKSDDLKEIISYTLFGWLLWGVALYFLFAGALSGGACILIAIALNFILYKLNRELSFLTLFLLPIFILGFSIVIHKWY